MLNIIENLLIPFGKISENCINLFKSVDNNFQNMNFYKNMYPNSVKYDF